MGELEKVVLNGSEDSNYPGILNMSFAGVEGESLLMRLPGVSLSSGSACTSASLEPSYVLRAMGSDVDLAHSSLRYDIWYNCFIYFLFFVVQFLSLFEAFETNQDNF